MRVIGGRPAKSKWARRVILGGLAMGVLAVGGAQWLSATRGPVADSGADPGLIARGAYIARSADCVACHTVPGGAPFAGGLAMQTPVGAIFSTNITPDPDTGIGRYSYADFARAVQYGVRRDGTPLYPAMPYPSYAIMPEADMRALYAWFMADVAPVRQTNAPADIPWPLNMRWPMAWWQLLFAPARDFVPPKPPTRASRAAPTWSKARDIAAPATPRAGWPTRKKPCRWPTATPSCRAP